MTTKRDKEHLPEMPAFDEFPLPTYEEWRQTAEKALKGAAFEEKLITKTYEGISLQPIYGMEDAEHLPHMGSLPGFAPFVRGTEPLGYLTRPWEVSQELAAITPEEFNRIARHDLERGQTMLNIPLAKAIKTGLKGEAASGTLGRDGLLFDSLKDLEQAFEGISLEQTPILLESGLGLPMLGLFAAYLQKQGIDAKNLKGCLGVDPLGTLAAEGTLPVSLKTAYDWVAEAVTWSSGHAPRLQTIMIQGTPYHNGGGHAIHELSYALATGVEYLRELSSRGISIEEAAKQIWFSFSIGSNFFMEIAKLRAARMLWANIVHSFGGSADAQKMKLHARTSAWNKTVYDPYVNMLRSTAEAFSGIIGGVNSLHVAPFDEPVGHAEEFSRRIARNAQLILQQEAHLAKVVDPAGGSWYIESLTDAVAQKAWELFQSIETNGGMFSALQKGIPQTEIADLAKERAQNIAQRKDRFVGTNMYPNLKEDDSLGNSVQKNRMNESACNETEHVKVELPKVELSKESLLEAAVKAVIQGATLGDMIEWLTPNEEQTQVKRVMMNRATEPFERLRANTQQFLQRTGNRPRVFLANLGPLAIHKARADFAAGFFEVGGFEVIGNEGFETPEQAAEAAKASAAPIVVICSGDDIYPQAVPTLAFHIKQDAPDVTVLLAGNPLEEQRQAYIEAGVDDFIHLRSNCYEMLLDLQQKKGISL